MTTMPRNVLRTEKPPHILELLRLQTELNENKSILPGVASIGAAYNPFLQYASINSITCQIFDWKKMATTTVDIKGKQYLVPEIVDVQSASTAWSRNSSGESIDSFQSDLSAMVKIGGRYKFFSGSLSVEFSDTSLTKSESSFSRIQQSINAWSLRLSSDNKLREALCTPFRDVLDSLPLTPEAVDKFFNLHGSHFLTGIVMGGRAVRASATNKLTVDHSFSLLETAQASFDFLVGNLSAENQTKYKTALESFKVNSESQGFAIGGKQSEKALRSKEDFEAWSDSVDENPDFVDFVTSIPMAEIWSLCKTPEQAEYLRKYYLSTWAPQASDEFKYYADWVDDLVIVFNDTSSEIAPPTGYSKIPDNLQDGTGTFMYLCTHKARYKKSVSQDLKSDTQSYCIDDVKIIEAATAGSGPPVIPDGYTKLPQNLNYDFQPAYICVRKVPYNNETAIKAVTVIYSRDPDFTPPYGFNKMKLPYKGLCSHDTFICTSTMAY